MRPRTVPPRRRVLRALTCFAAAAVEARAWRGGKRGGAERLAVARTRSARAPARAVAIGAGLYGSPLWSRRNPPRERTRPACGHHTRRGPAITADVGGSRLSGSAPLPARRKQSLRRRQRSKRGPASVRAREGVRARARARAHLAWAGGAAKGGVGGGGGHGGGMARGRLEGGKGAARGRGGGGRARGRGAASRELGVPAAVMGRRQRSRARAASGEARLRALLWAAH